MLPSPRFDPLFQNRLANGALSIGEVVMIDLKNFVQRVYIINLRRRVDRLHALMKRLEACRWPFAEPIIYPAIDGDKVGVPPEFTQGGGAYGCRMSHLRILQDCLMEDVESVMILEDDADFCEGFPEKVAEFLEKVPKDWEGIMLGGQHHAPPIDIGIPGVVRVRYAQRTHCYIARREYMKALQRRWGNATVHIDWLMRDWQHRHIVYAPDPWLVGQVGGRSDVAGREKPAEWWIANDVLPPGPVAVIKADRAVVDELVHYGIHVGLKRTAEGYDEGLVYVFATRDRAERIQRLREWLSTIQTECVGGLIPGVWHPEATTALVREAWQGPVFELTGQTAEEAYLCLPEDVRRRATQRLSQRIAPIILLRCPKDVIDQLHSYGFHPGYWRDQKTGLDVGLSRIMEEAVDPTERVNRLRDWCHYLLREAERDGLIVTAVHPALTRDVLERASPRPVVEIEATSIEQLRSKLLALWKREAIDERSSAA